MGIQKTNRTSSPAGMMTTSRSARSYRNCFFISPLSGLGTHLRGGVFRHERQSGCAPVPRFTDIWSVASTLGAQRPFSPPLTRYFDIRALQVRVYRERELRCSAQRGLSAGRHMAEEMPDPAGRKDVSCKPSSLGISTTLSEGCSSQPEKG